MAKVYVAIAEREEYPDVYALIDEVVANHYPDLADATIQAVWKYGCKPSKDGIKYSSVRKANPVEHAKMGADVILTINQSAWTHPEFTTRHRKVVIDSRLSQVRLVKDKEGEPKEGPGGGFLFRIAPHEFSGNASVFRRNGLVFPEDHYIAAAVRDIAARGETILGNLELATSPFATPDMMLVEVEAEVGS